MCIGKAFFIIKVKEFFREWKALTSSDQKSPRKLRCGVVAEKYLGIFPTDSLLNVEQLLLFSGGDN